MRASDAQEFRDAMDIEINTLANMKVWSVVLRSVANSHIVPATWTFRRKRFPDGCIKKHKARFCIRGDLQEDMGDTYAPVVSWISVRIMLYFALIFGFETRSVDYDSAFAQAELPTPIWIEFPLGFTSTEGDKSTHCLQLHKLLYGTTIAPMLWNLKLTKGLQSRGYRVSAFDPCLFIKGNILIACFVDDCVFCSPSAEINEREINSLRQDFDLTDEGDLSAFLGVSIFHNRKENTYTFTQAGLIDCIIDATGLETASSNFVPAVPQALGTDPDGPPYQQHWEYASVVGMLMFLANNSRPDIAFATHQCARFTHKTKQSHATAVKTIVRYLKGTRTKGLIFSPQPHLALDCFVDADFAGLWGVESPDDPICAKSRTGYVIMLCGCPLLWKSQLQTLVSLSTMEAEYIALSTSMRDLVPLRQLVEEIAIAIDATERLVVRTHSTVFEDNNGALALANLPRLTPRSKHIAVRMHWFREHVRSGQIHVVKVDTKAQIADIFTKGLTREAFERIHHLLMGW